MKYMRIMAGLASASLLAACGNAGKPERVTNFSAIGEKETINLVGTEPFWGGKVTGGSFTYTTPEDSQGTAIMVSRFSGNNGLGFSGTYGDQPIDLTVTPGECSDGMSDRTYPYVATLRVMGEQRTGCAWTTAQPFGGPENP